MHEGRAAQVLGVIVAVTGAVVTAGWLFDVPVLKSILPGWVTMKVSTALCFCLSGLVLVSLGRTRRALHGLDQVMLPVCALIILLFMATLLASSLTGVRTGIEDLLVREKPGAVLTTTPGRPSAGTMLCFILVAGAGLYGMFAGHRRIRVMFALGAPIAVLGAVAILGYCLDQPILYYTVEGWSTAMALHTAILFLLLGAGLLSLGRRGKELSCPSA